MKRKKIKLLAGAMIIAMTGAVFTGCGNNSTSNDGTVTITVSGSTSVGPLMEKIAEKYEEEVDIRISRAIAVLEPSLVAVLSVIVGVVLLSVMLPLLGIMSGMGIGG